MVECSNDEAINSRVVTVITIKMAVVQIIYFDLYYFFALLLLVVSNLGILINLSKMVPVLFFSASSSSFSRSYEALQKSYEM